MENHSDNDFFEEELEEVMAEASPQPINIPLEIQVGPIAESPESPSPSVSPGTPSPVALSPPPMSPVEDALPFMEFYTEDEIVILEQWAVDARVPTEIRDFRIEELEIYLNLKTSLRFTIGVQWGFKLVHPAGEVLICQLRAYLARYNLLTSFNRRQWLRLFRAWTLAEGRRQLELLANSGGFMDL